MKRYVQRNTKTGRTWVWSAWADGDKVYTRYGMLGGQVQEVCDTPGSKGKPGTAAYVSPEEQALLVVERLTRKRLKEGYVPEDQVEEAQASLNLLNDLPRNLCFPKPIKILPKTQLERVYGGVTETDFCFTRKRNGMLGVLVRYLDGRLCLYSRRLDPLNEHLPHILREVAPWLPPGSILLGELVNPEEQDDFAYIASVLRSLPERARVMQELDGRWLKFYTLSVFVWGEQQLWHELTAEQMICFLGTHIPEGRHVSQMQLIGVDDLEQLHQLLSKRREWEGAVIYLRDGRMDVADLSFAGKERRPPVYWKYKLSREEDFVILGWEPGTGRNQGLLGSVHVGRYNVQGGVIDYGWCGTGFDAQQRADLANDTIKGRVVQIEYESLTPDGKLRFPKFVRLRDDKSAEECIDDAE